MTISLDSFVPAIQYKLKPACGGDDYLQRIIGFLEFTVKNNPTLNLNLNMVVTNINYDNVENYFLKSELYRIKNVTLIKLVKMTQKFNELLPADKQIIDFKYRLKNMDTPVNFNRAEWLDNESCADIQKINSEISSIAKNKCFFYLYKILIDCQGQVLKCNGDPQKTPFNVYDEDLGDIYYKLIEQYKHYYDSTLCWDSCCSPIKAINQELKRCLDEESSSKKVIMDRKEFNITEFYIAITNRCNLKCIMCTTGKGKFDIQDEITKEEWKRLILNLNNDCNIERITFGGGEPLLRKDLPEIIKFVCATDIATVNIISNGILFNEEFLNNFSKEELKKIGIIFSIDGLEYTHDFIRGSGAFQKSFFNFKAIYHNYYKLQRINFLTVSSILMPENFMHYIAFLMLLKQYKGVRVDIQPVIPNNELCHVKGNFLITELEKNKLKDIIEYVKNNPDISARPVSVVERYIDYFDNKLKKSNRCLTGFESLNITFEGKPYLCGTEINMPLYKLRFKDVFNSSDYQKELERIKNCKEPCLQGLHINPDNY